MMRNARIHVDWSVGTVELVAEHGDVLATVLLSPTTLSETSPFWHNKLVEYANNLGYQVTHQDRWDG